MTHIKSPAADFAEKAVSGVCNAYPATIRRVDGGVARSHPTSANKVAVVIGGGSGHYPAFAGLVGTGLADAAAIGDVFASPSARRVAAVAQQSHRGAGVLLTYGNYQGDVLNFGAAAELLRSDGIDVRTVVVTDDIASAPKGEEIRRRGVAGDLVVFKIAGAAAEAGMSLQGVERVAVHANNLTRTLGVAFTGCTLPGATAPLFEIREGTLTIGMGIHGEPGLSENKLLPAADLAELLVDSLLAEAPEGSSIYSKATAVLNGLGNTKYEELFVLWSEVEPRLTKAGLTLIAPEVGEFVTSLDMAGCSLTITWLDDELADLWREPCDSVAFRRGARTSQDQLSTNSAPSNTQVRTTAPASAESRRGARDFVALLRSVEAVLKSEEVELGNLDARAGDGDHGRGMSRGSRAAVAAADDAVAAGAGAGTTAIRAGEAWADQAGGTSGILWGAALLRLGESIGDADELTDDLLRSSVIQAIDRMAEVGGAHRGDKTMLDAALPMREALGAGQSWADATSAAHDGAELTASMLPRRGRARTAGERNVGDRDPGAVSFALIAQAAQTAFQARRS